jgi:hypothetical protein
MRRRVAAVAAAAVIAVTVAVGAAAVRAPQPAPAEGPGDFSAARAVAHLAAVAAAPRPYASEAQRAVRAYVLTTLRAAGVEARAQRRLLLLPDDATTVAYVRNVVARIPGRDASAPAVLLVAHYDSVPVSPGAADNASGVAALLEAARALRAGPPLDGDVMLLFTDAEEVGLLGAEAFVRSPLADRVGLVLNFDNPGSGGPSILYETSSGDLDLVRAFAATVRAPYASSLSNDLARRRWIESDFSALRSRGLPGLTFGFTEGFHRNHKADDVAADLDPASLAHQGAAAVALARRFAGHELPSAEGDAVAFNLLGSHLVVYPRAWAWPLALVAVAAWGAVVALGRVRRRLTLAGVATGAVGSVLAFAFTAALVAVVWAFTQAAYGDPGSSALPLYNDGLHQAGLTALVAAVALAAYLPVLDTGRVLDLAMGALLWWALLGLYMARALPGGSYLLTWPLLAALAGMAVVFVVADPDRRSRRRAAACFAALSAGAVPGLLLASSSLVLLFAASGARLTVVVAAVWLVLGLLLPLLDLIAWPRRWPLPAALAAFGVFVFVGLSPLTGYGEAHPRENSLFYRQDEAGAALWGTIDREPDGWTRHFVAEAATRNHQYFPLWGFRSYHRDIAPRLGLPAPRADVLADRVEGARRTLTLRVRSPRGAPFLTVLVENDVGLVTARLQGLTLAAHDTYYYDHSGARWHLDLYDLPAEGVTLEITLDAGAPLQLRLVDADYGLPAEAAGYGLRPAGFVQGALGDASFADRLMKVPAAR